MAIRRTSAQTRWRDPAGPARLGWAVFALLVLWPLFQGAGVQPSALLDASNLRVIGGFLAGFLPPDTSLEFAGYLWQASLETLAIATMGLLLAVLLAVPLAYWATSAVRERATQNPVARGILTVLRGIPELVWALVFVRVFGLGPAAGVLALGLTYAGMLGKVYAEILESETGTAARALLRSGSPRAIALLYGLLPLASKELVSYTVYRWECAIRASVVMGFVGAGGLGQLMDQAMKMLNGGEASSILLVFIALVFMADLLSSALRRSLDALPAARCSPWGWRSALFVLVLGWAIVASWRLLDMGLGALLSVQALSAMGDFVADFFPPETGRAWLWRVAVGVWETLAISVVGTLLAALAGFVLALPKWRAPWNVLLNLLRSVPELVWATITVLAVGLGPFAGALALALHTAGVLGRLYAQAFENAPKPPPQALRHAGSSNTLAFLYGTLPGAAPQLLAYTLYRWEMNIRMAAILGFVGAGGLGQLLYVKLSLFHYAEASTVIIAMLLLSIAVDQTSAWLRRAMR
ncbi:PhnE/PtxC family ABC transporter permease [Lampropedia aestuarii]|uniref:PhnE/PtxC family ABC transporter permease n=1 Tax=Lampropedia aestuarii TaxID=2562762 RepID=UPI002468DB16|nr:ABC transporter permease subunit [Lampropedia aestuarii]MDH5855919.1 ABC transporter permease subunit [Lampropedia aestuarii]